jgi:SAM-dependent methyltransferase
LLEVGCGRGQWLATFEEFGVVRHNLAGIELDPDRHEFCARRFVGADIRCGDAARLPWPDDSFDVAFQATVFTSILDHSLKQSIAGEMLRVLRPGGCVLWYDFFVNNPRNPHVRGISRREIQELFAGCTVRLRRVTLAPPLARRLAAVSWNVARLLESVRLFNTHYLAVIRRL